MPYSLITVDDGPAPVTRPGPTVRKHCRGFFGIPCGRMVTIATQQVQLIPGVWGKARGHARCECLYTTDVVL